MLKKSQSQKKNEKMPICKNCKYIALGKSNTCPYSSYEVPVCTLETVKEQRKDPVTGNKTPIVAISCYEKNGKGQCEDFKEIGFLKKLGRFFWMDRIDRI